MNKTIQACALALLFLASCDWHKKPSGADHTPPVEDVKKADSHGKAIALHLNGGQKWKANPATQEGMLAMGSLLESMPIDEWSALGDSLKAQTQNIIKQCDMKGEAHEQLHLVLMPMIGTIDSLQNAADDASAKALHAQLTEQLATYHAYFGQ